MADLAVMVLNKLRGKPLYTPLLPQVPPVTPVFTMKPWQKADENKKLAMLEPSTREFTKKILTWARANGLRAYLGETYRSMDDQAAIEPGRTGITPGKIGWHQVGRAFHLVIKDERGRIDKDAYKTVGDEVEKRGGVWLGRTPIMTPKGPVTDLAHFEYHPGLSIGPYRKSPLSRKEMASAEKRAARYGYA